jgi:Saxitoxin biosynthesis operon protein SxtJ
MTTITRDQCRDTGMAMVLLLLLIRVRFGNDAFLWAALVVQVVNMVVPQAFRPVARVWFPLTHAIGAVVSRVLLSVVFGLVVTPIGLIRRAMGKDSLRLKAFKADSESVMITRNHTFTAGDVEKPY